MSWIDRVDLDQFWRYAKPGAVGGLVVSVLLVAASLLPSAPHLPYGVTILLDVAAAPLVLGVVLSLKRAQATSPLDLLRAVSPAMRVFGATVFVGAWLVGMSSMLRGGSLERHGDRYFQNNHGDLKELSRDEYQRRSASNERETEAGAAAFCVIGVMGAAAHPRLRAAARTPGEPITTGCTPMC